jgi:hypothetical protein
LQASVLGHERGGSTAPALSRGLAVWGSTREEALMRFQEAVAKNAEIRARPDPWGKEPTEVG